MDKNEYLRLESAEIEKIVNAELADVTPSPDQPLDASFMDVKRLNIVKQGTAWKNDFHADEDRKKIRNRYIFLPLVFLPTAILAFSKLFLPAGLWFVAAIVYTMYHYWFFGRLIGWETKKHDSNLRAVELAHAKIVDKTVNRWARARYELPNDFEIRTNESMTMSMYGRDKNGKETTYKWTPVGTSEQYILSNEATGEEAPLRTK